ncbi:uncharacterized protein [Diadema setosum]|uniref:uncharacterized protein n=1 Tax=Diadema setosum TaxID=31175 RepID=UPI003B3BDA3F
MSQPDKKPSRLCILCLPRSGSTSLLKCLSFFEDSEVWFEPFVIGRLVKTEYKRNTGRELPTEWDEAHAEQFEQAATFMQAINKQQVNGKNYAFSEIKRSIESSQKPVVIVKDMGTSFLGRLQYLPSPDMGFKYVFVIRNPYGAIASFRRASLQTWRNYKTFTGSDEEFDLFTDDRYYRSPGGCFRILHGVWKHVREKIDPNPLVIDTEDFLADPKAFLQKICEVAGLRYHDGLLQWDPTPAVVKTWRNAGGVNHLLGESLVAFHGTAINSSCFFPRKRQAPPDRSTLTPDVLRAVDEGMEFYMDMYQHRFVPGKTPTP